MPMIERLPDEVAVWIIPLLTLAASTIGALILHRAMFGIVRRLARRTPGRTDDILVASTEAPTRWIVLVIALAAALRALALAGWLERLWVLAAGLALPALCGWLGVALVRAFGEIVAVRADVSVADNLRARRSRTRVRILGQIAIFIIMFLTLSIMLLSIPGVRNIGLTLMASAGIAGIVVGTAAQPALKNLIAGVQLAFTQPIRLDDVVVIGGEWGRIEDIHLTYVVVHVWDDRRLVVPVSKFLEEPFQNWTIETSQLLGSVFVYVDPAADVERIRTEAAAIADASPLWDRRFTNLQVTDLKDDVMELRVLVTASDASHAFDLRCEVREKLVAFLRDAMPEALPRHRQVLVDKPLSAAATDR